MKKIVVSALIVLLGVLCAIFSSMEKTGYAFITSVILIVLSIYLNSILIDSKKEEQKKEILEEIKVTGEEEV